jgi:hypothetical protein
MPQDQEPWITTFTGKQFFMRKATHLDIDIRDIAHGLSNVCRYVGQCQPFYSVAEHSARMAALAPKEIRLPTLLHDSPEAYLGDMPTTVKAVMPEYKAMEKYLLGVIFDKYRIEWDPYINELDSKIRTPEVLSLLVGGHAGWKLGDFEYGPIIPWSPIIAEAEFLRMFGELTGEHYTVTS